MKLNRQQLTRTLRELLHPRGFLMSAGALSVSTCVAQVLAILATLAATKLFALSDFGFYMVFLSHAAMVMTVNVLSYPMALPKLTDAEVTPVVWGIAAVVALVSTLVFAGYALAGYAYAGALALYTGARGVIAVFDMLNLRSKRYTPIVCARIAPGLLLLLVLVWIHIRPGAGIRLLVWGHTSAVVLTVAAYAVASARLLRPGRVCWARTWAVLKRERQFPLLNSPSDLCTAAAYHLPTVMMGSLFPNGAALAGQYGLVLRFCFGPANILGVAVGQVFHAELGEQHRRRGGIDFPRYRRILGGLLCVGIAAAACVFLLFPPLVEWFYGPDWSEAQTFARILSPLVCFMIWVNPLTVSFFVLGHLEFFLGAQVCYLLTTLMSFALGASRSQILLAIGLFSALSCLRYIAIAYKVDWMMRRNRLRQTLEVP